VTFYPQGVLQGNGTNEVDNL